MGETHRQHVIVVPAHTIIHTCLDDMVVKYVQYITRSVCNRNKSKQALQIHPVYLTEYDHDYILDEIGNIDKIEYEGNISIGDKEG